MSKFLKHLVSQPFFGTAEQDQHRKNSLKLPSAEIRYVIFFNPRSASSRLTDLATKTRVLSEPGECFNPGFIPGISKAYGARNMPEYLDLLFRRRNTKGIFGCQVTYIQLMMSFWTGQRFWQQVKPTHTIWLIREDIVMQAISLSRLIQTKLAHSVSTTPEEIEKSKKNFHYDGKEIKRTIKSLVKQEQRVERLLRKKQSIPLRLSYEMITTQPPIETVNMIARHLGLEDLDLPDLSSTHQKIGDGKNAEFANRFKAEYAGFLEKTASKRAVSLSLLKQQTPQQPITQ